MTRAAGKSVDCHGVDLPLGVWPSSCPTSYRRPAGCLRPEAQVDDVLQCSKRGVSRANVLPEADSRLVSGTAAQLRRARRRGRRRCRGLPSERRVECAHTSPAIVSAVPSTTSIGIAGVERRDRAQPRARSVLKLDREQALRHGAAGRARSSAIRRSRRRSHLRAALRARDSRGSRTSESGWRCSHHWSY